MIRQPASENSFTVACPIPREAPVSTMVLCSAAGRTICGGVPGNGQRPAFSGTDPSSDRRSGSALRISTIMAARCRLQHISSGFPDLPGFARSGPTRRNEFPGVKSHHWTRLETDFEGPAQWNVDVPTFTSYSAQSGSPLHIGETACERSTRYGKEALGLVRFLQCRLR